MSSDAGIIGSTNAATLSSAASPRPSSKTLKDLASIEEVVKGYRATCTLRISAHNKKAEKYHKRNLYLGVPASVIAAVVGSSIFATLSSEKNIYLLVTAGSLSILAAILSALQTFLKYSEMAQAHKLAQDGYESLRRQIDIFILKILASKPLTLSEAQKELQGIVDQLNALSASSPIVSHESILDAAKAAAEQGAAIMGAAMGSSAISQRMSLKNILIKKINERSSNRKAQD